MYHVHRPSSAAGKLPPPAILPRSWLQWSATKPDLVSVGIAVRDLAHSVRVGFPLQGVESTIGYLRDERIEVIDEESVPGTERGAKLYKVELSVSPRLDNRQSPAPLARYAWR